MKKITLLFMCIIYASSYSQDIELEMFATGFSSPVNVKHAGDDRLFVVERSGVIKILNADGTTNSTSFLDISGRVTSGGEQGLLAMAFHPNYSANGYFYVNYINSSGDTVISRFTRATADTADDNSELILMTISQPFGNHNGGDMHFGTDGYLYISTGDGGSGNDPGNRAQDLGLLLGKILRIDVDGTSNGNYGIPPDNPFVGNSTALDEIWAYGLRNPWKWSFDRDNGDMWIADVGQSAREEINKVPASSTGGENYGWKCYEGSIIGTFVTGCDAITHTPPVAEYNYGGTPFKCSITGGYRYRGTLQSSLEGFYFFADYCSDQIGIVRETSPDVFQLTFEDQFNGGISAFAEDVNGELFVVGLVSGTISRIIDANLSIDEATIESVKMFPNPSDAVVNFDTTGTSSQINMITFYNILGKTVKTVSEFTNQNISISTKNLPSGIYLVEISGINGNKDTRKLVVN
ncbi:MAG: T9SS type A sorting domain-containing protein [Algicola sp.]|nr:T9SS type A sorting domain-containing protein [Algicola sp.]